MIYVHMGGGGDYFLVLPQEFQFSMSTKLKLPFDFLLFY